MSEVEGEFWNNLDSYVEQKNVHPQQPSKSPSRSEKAKRQERVGRWLKAMPNASDRLKPSNSAESDSNSLKVPHAPSSSTSTK